MFPTEETLFSLRVEALTERIDVIRAGVCHDPAHQLDVDFYLAVLGWDLESFTQSAFMSEEWAAS